MILALDLDGVLVDVKHVAEKYLIQQKDWRAYFDKTLEFPPIEPMVLFLQAFMAGDRHSMIYFVTGRPESNRELTETWLRRNVFYGALRWNTTLVMRANGDQRKTYEVKLQALKWIHPDLVFEDDPEAVQEMLKAGYVVVQVHGFRYTRNDLIPPVE